MTSLRRRLALMLSIALISALVLAAVACGDDDDDDDSDEPQPTATTQADGDPTEAPTEADDEEPTEAPDDGGNTEPAAEIAVGDIFFNPTSATVSVGDTVVWVWQDQLPHSVVGTFNGEDVQSDVLTGAGQFSFTFESAGTFDYICGIHGQSMTGRITVQ